jgi:hypothetical protein
MNPSQTQLLSMVVRLAVHVKNEDADWLPDSTALLDPRIAAWVCTARGLIGATCAVGRSASWTPSLCRIPLQTGSTPIADGIKSSDCRHLHIDAFAIDPDRPRQSRLCHADQASGNDHRECRNSFVTHVPQSPLDLGRSI